MPLGLIARVANTGSDVAYLAYRRMPQITSTAREPQDPILHPRSRRIQALAQRRAQDRVVCDASLRGRRR